MPASRLVEGLRSPSEGSRGHRIATWAEASNSPARAALPTGLWRYGRRYADLHRTRHAEIPNLVVAKGLLSGDERTADLAVESKGGSERSISVPAQAADKAAANIYALDLLREVLGASVTGEMWIESTNIN